VWCAITIWRPSVMDDEGDDGLSYVLVLGSKEIFLGYTH
jgi:hypothetical protein